MKHSSNAAKLAGAVALAGSSQAYGQIIPLTPLPGDITVAPSGEYTEYYTINGGTSTSPGGDLEFDVSANAGGNLSFDVLPVQATDAVVGVSGLSCSGFATYAFPSTVAAGAKIGTNSPDTPFFFKGDPSEPFVVPFPIAQAENSPQFIGFQFTDPLGPSGNVHDGYLEIDSLTPGVLTFVAGAYNSTADDSMGGGNIVTALAPEPSTLSALVLGAAALGGVGLLRRRRSILA